MEIHMKDGDDVDCPSCGKGTIWIEGGAGSLCGACYWSKRDAEGWRPRVVPKHLPVPAPPAGLDLVQTLRPFGFIYATTTCIIALMVAVRVLFL